MEGRKKYYNILIGGLFFIIPPLQFFSLGFISEKMENLIALDMKTPKWDENWMKMFKKGLRLSIILAGYMAIPCLMMFLSGFFTTILSRGKIMSLFFFRGQILSMITGFLFLVAVFFMLFGFAEAVQEEKLNMYIRRAFDIKKILERISLVLQDYLMIFGLIVVVYMVSAIIIFLFLNSIAGFLLSGFILFFDGFFTIHLISKVYPRKEIKIKSNL